MGNCMLIFSISYEVQLVPSGRGQGLGQYLMDLLWRIGNYWGMDKVMLTVFKGMYDGEKGENGFLLNGKTNSK